MSPSSRSRAASVTVAMLVITILAGCQSSLPAPGSRMVATGGIELTFPTGKFDGKVGDKQYEPFELGPISQRIGSDFVVTTVSLGGASFSVVGPKPGPGSKILILIHEALRGSDIKTAEGHADFVRKLKTLFALHKEEISGFFVAENGIVMDLR